MLLKQIQYFLAVAESRHFTQAANRLFVSQSALSQQINKLESDLGVKLINRVSHPIELTAAGKLFYDDAKKILNDVQSLEQKMQRFHLNDKSTLRLGMITGLGTLPLSDILSRFNTKYPQIKFSLVNHLSKQLCNLLNNDELDIAIFATPRDINSYNFDIIPLQDEPFVAILPKKHPLSINPILNLRDTVNENFIFPTADNVSYDIFLSECKKCGFTPHIISYCNNPGRRIDLVQSGLGIALISQSALRYYTQLNGVTVLPLVNPFYKHIVIARQKKTICHAQKTFWNYILQYYKNLKNPV